MNCSQALKIIQEASWYIVAQRGSHLKLKHHQLAGTLIFPNHGSKELGNGLQKKILNRPVSNAKHMHSKKKKIVVIVEKTKTGYSAYAEDEAVFSTGKDIESLHRNLLEAFHLAYEESGLMVAPEDLCLRLDLKQFFRYYKVLNAKFLAKRIGMNPTLLSQYVRGKKQPSTKQLDKILLGIQSIGRELAALQLV